jgi:UDP-glucose 4-epimerase
MKALVFGSEGFIGKHLCKELKERGWEVEGFDWNAIARRDQDIRDSGVVLECVNRIHPDVAFHFAAISDLQECLSDPISAEEVNVGGTLNALDAIRSISANLSRFSPTFVYASSVYAHNEDSGPYGITKAASEAFIRFYAKKYGIRYIILRYGTVYGPGAPENNSIRKLVRKALDENELYCYGNGSEIREYIHVKDVARCTVEVVEKGFVNETFVISGITPIKAEDMAGLIGETLGKRGLELTAGLVYGLQHPEGHYVRTPYRYQPHIAKKYIPDSMYDLAAGILEVIEEEESAEKELL